MITNLLKYFIRRNIVFVIVLETKVSKSFLCNCVKSISLQISTMYKILFY